MLFNSVVYDAIVHSLLVSFACGYCGLVIGCVVDGLTCLVCCIVFVTWFALVVCSFVALALRWLCLICYFVVCRLWFIVVSATCRFCCF